MDAARFFLPVSLVFALLYAVLTPPYQVADEYAHFERSFAISNGEFLPLANPGPGTEGWFIPLTHSRAKVIGGGTRIPESVIRSYQVVDYLTFRPETRIRPEVLFDELKKPLASARSAFLTNNAVVYTPIPYLPQTLAFTVLKPFDLSPFWLVYGGRFAVAIVWSLLVYTALRLLPYGRWIMAFVALSPMAISLGGSLSADPVTTGCFFLFTALLLRHTNGERIPGRALLLMLGLCLLLAGCKSVYALLLPLVFFWTPKQFGSRIRYVAFILCALGLPALFCTWWGGHVQAFYLTADNARPGAQAEFIRQQPLEFAHVVARTVAEYSRVYARHFAGSLGWLDAQLPFAVAALYCLGLLLIGVSEAAPAAGAKSDSSNALRLTRWRRALCLLLFGLLFLIMCVSMYIVWNDYRNPVIVGLHGRYFIPLAPLGLICLFWGVSTQLHEWQPAARLRMACRTAIPVLLLFCLLTGAGTLIGRYYGVGPLQPPPAPRQGAPALTEERGHPIFSNDATPQTRLR